MGCDIHVDVEVKINGEWKWVLEGVPEGVNVNSLYSLPTNRNYDFFGLLAGVRNGEGFAGCDTGDPVDPIAEGRGWPDDMSDALKEAIKSRSSRVDNWPECRSKTHVTATELRRFDPESVVKTKRAYVGKEVLDKTEPGDSPEGSYCGDCHGDKFVKISYEKYESMEEDDFKDDKTYMVEYEWEESMKEHMSFNRLWDWFNSPGFAHHSNDKIEETRFIIGFDN